MRRRALLQAVPIAGAAAAVLSPAVTCRAQAQARREWSMIASLSSQNREFAEFINDVSGGQMMITLQTSEGAGPTEVIKAISDGNPLCQHD